MRKLVYKKILYFLLLATPLLQYGCKEEEQDIALESFTLNTSDILIGIDEIQSVVAVHKGLKDWDPLRVNGHLADQKFESRGKLSAKDQSAGVEKIIPLQKGTFRRKFRNLQISVRGTGRSGFLIWHVIAGTGTLQVLFQLLLADAKLFSYFRRI